MRIFLTDKGTATITCPQCQTTVTKNIAKKQNAEEIKKIKISCHCGHSFIALLEKRRYYRKRASFSGRYTCPQSDGKTKWGFFTVVEASRSGLQLKLDVRSDLNVGDKLEIEFWIDKDNQILVNKQGAIQRVTGRNVSMKFSTTEHYDNYGKFLFS